MEQVEKKKPGPAPKPKIEPKGLQDRIEQLEAILIEVATHTGYSSVLRKHGLSSYKPTKKDMTKFK